MALPRCAPDYSATTVSMNMHDYQKLKLKSYRMNELEQELVDLRIKAERSDTRIGVLQKIRDNLNEHLKDARQEIGCLKSYVAKGQAVVNFLKRQLGDLHATASQDTANTKALEHLRKHCDHQDEVIASLNEQNVTHEREVVVRYLREFANSVEELQDHENMVIGAVDKEDVSGCDIGLHC